MRVKLDENIPASLIEVLESLGHQADTVQQEGLKGRNDTDVWSAAQGEPALLITQDLDFSDIRRFQPGSHHGILLLRLKEPGRSALADRIGQIFRTEDVNRWDGCFVVATERKIRVRLPDVHP